MADLTKILGGPWAPPAAPVIAPPEMQFREAMLEAGITPPDEIILDGQLRRFRTDSKRTDRSGWYVGHADGICTIIFGDWRQGIEKTIKAATNKPYTVAEEMAHVARIAAAKAARDLERKKQNEAAASTVEIIWSEGAAASPTLAQAGSMNTALMSKSEPGAGQPEARDPTNAARTRS